MRRRTPLAVLGLVTLSILGSGAAVPSAPGAPATPETFRVDPAHSMLMYKLRHFGVSNFWGRIIMPKGTFRLDEDDLSGSFVNITAEIKNMDAGNQDRDRFLKGPDFFNVREYPEATFTSTSARSLGSGAFEVDGRFTMHGVTKPVTARLEGFTARPTDRFGFRGGFEATFTVKRSEYGMGLFVDDGTLGDEVTIIAALEGVKAES